MAKDKTEIEAIREKAVGELLDAAAIISDKYSVCLICLTYSMADVIASAEEKGMVQHAAGEWAWDMAGGTKH